MSDTAVIKKKDRPTDQPMPVGGEECVQDALVAEILARKEIGIQTYGTPLMTFNGRNAVRDARDELLDGAVYLQQVAMEADAMAATLRRIDNVIALDNGAEPGTEGEHGFNVAINLVRLARHPKAARGGGPTDLELETREAIRAVVLATTENSTQQAVEEIYSQIFAPMAEVLEATYLQIKELACTEALTSFIQAEQAAAEPGMPR